MNCKCGGNTTSTSHEVKSLKVAQEWEESITEGDLPVKIDNNICPACGRQYVMIFNDSKLFCGR